MVTNTCKKILVVEDEPHLAFNLEFNLHEEGYEVVLAKSGTEAINFFTLHGPFNLIILDVMLPEINGFDVATAIRKTDRKTGILMLTARASDEDIIRGLQTGVDDYLTKPFRLKELLLRVERMVKRSEFYNSSPADSSDATVLNQGSITLDIDSLELKTPKGVFQLTLLEANVLSEFLNNPERTLTRDYLLEKVWGMNGNVETRTVDNFVMRLRKYIENDPSKPEYLLSIRGKGYRLMKGTTSGTAL